MGVYPIQLPGRENRIGEKLCGTIEEAINNIIDEIKDYLDLPFAFVGHSMGGLMCYETVRVMQERDMNLPAGILISGTVAPDKLKLTEHISELDDNEFCEKIMGYDNIDPKMLQYKEFYKCFLPVLKNDFSMVEKYNISSGKKVRVNISVAGGNEDPYVPIEYLKDWRGYTELVYKERLFEGNHFFIKECIKEICKEIEALYGGK